jgi:hypothetical protein
VGENRSRQNRTWHAEAPPRERRLETSAEETAAEAAAEEEEEEEETFVWVVVVVVRVGSGTRGTKAGGWAVARACVLHPRVSSQPDSEMNGKQRYKPIAELIDQLNR